MAAFHISREVDTIDITRSAGCGEESGISTAVVEVYEAVDTPKGVTSEIPASQYSLIARRQPLRLLKLLSVPISP